MRSQSRAVQDLINHDIEKSFSSEPEGEIRCEEYGENQYHKEKRPKNGEEVD